MINARDVDREDVVITKIKARDLDEMEDMEVNVTLMRRDVLMRRSSVSFDFFLRYRSFLLTLYLDEFTKTYFSQNCPRIERRSLA